MADTCLFCGIVAGDVPADKVYEDEEILAFRDIHPAAPTHILLIPKKHIARISDAAPEDAGLLGRLLLRANEVAAEAGVAEPGFRYVFNCNEHGQQTVFHIHLHLLGGRPMSWPPG